MRYYKAADLFLLPSHSEGLSNAMVEAMASGLPSICSAVGGALEWIRHGANGFLFSPGDARELGDAIGDMLSCKDRWQEMGRVSRRLVEDELTFSATGRRLLQGLADERS